MDLLGVEEDLMCAVCRDVLVRPVTLSCGHSYCEVCVDKLRVSHCRCPLCLAPCGPNTVLCRNVTLCAVAERCRQERGPGRRCVEHDRQLELYCETDGALLCAYCMLPAHATHLEGHRVITLEEAVKKAKAACQERLAKIRTSLSQLEDSIQKLQGRTTVSKGRLEAQEQVYTSFLSRVKLFVEVERRAWLKRFSVASVEEEQRLCSREERLRRSRRCALEEEQHLSDTQQSGDVLKLLQLLKTPDWEEQSENGLLAEQEPSVSRIPLFHTLQKVFKADRIRLDVRTAHPQLEISADGRGVRMRRCSSDAPCRPGCFTSSYCVLGGEALSCGLHYWEVCVSGLLSWALGVSYSSMVREQSPSPCGILPSNEQSWLLGYSGERRQFVAQHACMSSAFSSSSEPPGRVGVFLDADSGILCLYDAQRLCCLHTFYCNLTSPVHPVFCPQLDASGPCADEYMTVVNTFSLQ